LNRCSLAEDVDVDVDEEKRFLLLKVLQCHFLTQSEKERTNLYQHVPTFDCAQKEDDCSYVLPIPLPKDLKMETIVRNDVDTEYGWILEISFERKKVIDKSKLGGKRFSHMCISSKSSVKLANVPEKRKSTVSKQLPSAFDDLDEEGNDNFIDDDQDNSDNENNQSEDS
jgi:hypothetical protein